VRIPHTHRGFFLEAQNEFPRPIRWGEGLGEGFADGVGPAESAYQTLCGSGLPPATFSKNPAGRARKGAPTTETSVLLGVFIRKPFPSVTLSEAKGLCRAGLGRKQRRFFASLKNDSIPKRGFRIGSMSAVGARPRTTSAVTDRRDRPPRLPAGCEISGLAAAAQPQEPWRGVANRHVNGLSRTGAIGCRAVLGPRGEVGGNLWLVLHGEF